MQEKAQLEDTTVIYLWEVSGYLQEESKFKFSLHVKHNLDINLFHCSAVASTDRVIIQILRSRMKKWGPVHFSKYVHKHHKESQMSHIPNTQTLLVHSFCSILPSLAKSKIMHL